MNDELPRPILARQSIQIRFASTLLGTGAMAGIFSVIRILRVALSKEPWSTLTVEDFVQAGLALQMVLTGAYWVWNRFFEPSSRPIQPGRATEFFANLTAPLLPK